MTNKIKGFIDKILSKKAKFDIDNDGKIESYREEIQGVFSQFKIMSDKLESVNSKLQDVVTEELITQDMEEDKLQKLIEESNKRIEDSMKRAEKASNEIVVNKKLQEKVSEFIK